MHIAINPRLLLIRHRLGQCRGLATVTQIQASIEPQAGIPGVYTLTLNRPEAKNSLGRQLMTQLREALRGLKLDQAKCLLIQSNVAGTFCAGADLKERAAMTPEEGGEFVKTLRATFSAIADLPVPTIAVVDGYAIGGGTELALAADLRVAGPSAQFSLRETRLGIIPGAGGTQRLPRLIGRSKAKEMIFTGRFVGPEEALDVGLADHMTMSGSAEQLALELAAQIAQAAPIALRSAKAAINEGLETDLANGMNVEEQQYAKILTTEDRLEGMRAFKEKRAPKFIGK
ncbi:hypothetical protein ABBQ32_007742 [Trebouxia sp. C0010 RCD-2024]